MKERAASTEVVPEGWFPIQRRPWAMKFRKLSAFILAPRVPDPLRDPRRGKGAHPLSFQMSQQRLQTQEIASPAEAADLTDAHGSQHRCVAERLASVDIR